MLLLLRLLLAVSKILGFLEELVFTFDALVKTTGGKPQGRF